MSDIGPGDMVTIATRHRGWAAFDPVSGPTGELVDVFRNAAHAAFVLAVVWLSDRSACYTFVSTDKGQAWFPIEELTPDGRFK